MSPLQKIQHLVLLRAASFADAEPPVVSADNVDALYQQLVDDEDHWDAVNEVREGEVETGVKCEWSRHYESKSVAAKYIDGTWVGWTYWYGGGKHGEPESIDWMEDAYDLNVAETEKVVTVREFAKTEPKP